MIQTTRKFINLSSNLLARKQNDILLASLVIMISYSASLILGLLRQRLMGSVFFDCCAVDLDAFQAAFRLPDLIFQTVVSGILATSCIPIFAQRFSQSSTKGSQVATSILMFLLTIMIGFAILVIIFAPMLARLMTVNFSTSQITTMANLMRIIFSAQIIFLFSNWIGTLLQTMKRFIAPALAPITYNIGIISGIVFLSKPLGIYGPAVGVVLGALMHLVVQIVVLRQTEFSFTSGWSIWNKDVKEVLLISWPRLLTQASVQLESNLTMYFASSLAAGSLFLFDLAALLRQVPVQIVGLAIGQAAFPSLSEYAHNNSPQFKKIAQDTFMQMYYLVLPLTSILLILRIPIVRLAFGTASFPWAATKETAYTLGIFTILIPSLVLSQLLLRSYYAYKNTKTPMVIHLSSLALFSVIGWISINQLQFFGQVINPINVINTPWLNLTLFNFDNPLQALAYAVVFTALVRTSLIFWFIRDKMISNLQRFRLEFLKLTSAGAIMIISLWIPFQFLDRLVFDTTRVIPLVALTFTTSAIGFVVYIISCHILDIQAQHTIWKLLIKFPGFGTLVNKTQSWMSSPIPEINNP